MAVNGVVITSVKASKGFFNLRLHPVLDLNARMIKTTNAEQSYIRIRLWALQHSKWKIPDSPLGMGVHQEGSSV